METALLFTFILLGAELFEAYIQRAPTLLGILERLNVYYQKSIFLFFAVHPGFYFVLFVVIATDILNVSMIFLIAMKVFDIFYKLELLKKVFKERVVSKELAQMMMWRIPSWYFLLGPMIYPPLLLYALT
ncbi:hypothetical protein PGH07_03640 [Sulfurovum sp. zt1-1]|uniref:Uncharacterized protein n=1 Tax=Sulfurovum zhangzhouensis TaxID=3019067 RepID=A0ABT7QWP6_9BACT|nr:hypothetical protein [Sulfurovum zhangzhouensis]MDM5271260.1 hypothetical protein [Sulfurovum zhangzhouensis]